MPSTPTEIRIPSFSSGTIGKMPRLIYKTKRTMIAVRINLLWMSGKELDALLEISMVLISLPLYIIIALVGFLGLLIDCGLDIPTSP
jgi:hypothetical protein